MQKQGIDALKRMALMAKNRLRNKVKENNNKQLKKNDSYKVLFGEIVDIKSKIITKEDDKLYEKVNHLLEQDADVVNPLAYLIDYKVYNKLMPQAQERYIFNLVCKYKIYKAKYEQEKNIG